VIVVVPQKSLMSKLVAPYKPPAAEAGVYQEETAVAAGRRMLWAVTGYWVLTVTIYEVQTHTQGAPDSLHERAMRIAILVGIVLLIYRGVGWLRVAFGGLMVGSGLLGLAASAFGMRPTLGYGLSTLVSIGGIVGGALLLHPFAKDFQLHQRTGRRRTQHR